jgi:hypothetical protein
MPIDSDIPAFRPVARIPDAAPRYLAGTLLMIAELFGDVNKPWLTPARARRRANAQ